MIEIKTVEREGKGYSFPAGMDQETGHAPVYVEHHAPHPFYLQPTRAVWEETKMVGGQDGDLKQVLTTYRLEVLDNAGNVIPFYTRRITEKTSDPDLLTFKRQLFPVLGPSTLNIYFKGGDGPDSGFLGQADNAPFVNGVFVADNDPSRPADTTTRLASWAYNAKTLTEIEDGTA